MLTFRLKSTCVCLSLLLHLASLCLALVRYFFVFDTHAHAHTRTHTHRRAHTHTEARTHTHTHTHTLRTTHGSSLCRQSVVSVPVRALQRQGRLLHGRGVAALQPVRRQPQRLSACVPNTHTRTHINTHPRTTHCMTSRCEKTGTLTHRQTPTPTRTHKLSDCRWALWRTSNKSKLCPSASKVVVGSDPSGGWGALAPGSSGVQLGRVVSLQCTAAPQGTSTSRTSASVTTSCRATRSGSGTTAPPSTRSGRAHAAPSSTWGRRRAPAQSRSTRSASRRAPPTPRVRRFSLPVLTSGVTGPDNDQDQTTTTLFGCSLVLKFQDQTMTTWDWTTTSCCVVLKF